MDTVEVDETYIGAEEAGLRGRRAKGKKALVGVAVELKQPRGFGRSQMAVLADGSAASLHPFVTAHVEPGATVITDAWQGYTGIGLGYVHVRRSPAGDAGPRGRSRRDAARRAPGRLPYKTVAARHPTRGRRTRRTLPPT